MVTEPLTVHRGHALELWKSREQSVQAMEAAMVTLVHASACRATQEMIVETNLAL